MLILWRVILVFLIFENRDKILMFFGNNGFNIEKWYVIVYIEKLLFKVLYLIEVFKIYFVWLWLNFNIVCSIIYILKLVC